MSTLSSLSFAMPGGIEWLVVLIVALLIFGPRLPKVMRGLGSSVREFRGGLDERTATSQASGKDDADQRLDGTSSKA